jgi:hypothetical protein
VQAYRRARHRGDGELTAFNHSADVAKALGRPLGKIDETARVLIGWASTMGMVLQSRAMSQAELANQAC